MAGLNGMSSRPVAHPPDHFLKSIRMKNLAAKSRLAFVSTLGFLVTFSMGSPGATQPRQPTQPLTQLNVTTEPGVATLPRNGGAPGKVLTSYFAAIGKRDWKAIKALTHPEIRGMMEEDEVAGISVDVLNRMVESSPLQIEIVEAWIEAEVVAHVRYSGRVHNAPITGHAELAKENGEWLVTLAGVGH